MDRLLKLRWRVLLCYRCGSRGTGRFARVVVLWNPKLGGQHFNSCRLPWLELWHSVIGGLWLNLLRDAVHQLRRVLWVLLLPLGILRVIALVLQRVSLHLWSRILLSLRISKPSQKLWIVSADRQRRRCWGSRRQQLRLPKSIRAICSCRISKVVSFRDVASLRAWPKVGDESSLGVAWLVVLPSLRIVTFHSTSSAQLDFFQRRIETEVRRAAVIEEQPDRMPDFRRRQSESITERVVLDGFAGLPLRAPSPSGRDRDMHNLTTESGSQERLEDVGRRRPYLTQSSPVMATTRYSGTREYS